LWRAIGPTSTKPLYASPSTVRVWHWAFKEAERITDFDSLAEYAGGRIVTENMDHRFGYFENDDLKKFAKKIVGYQKRAYELSIYSMAKMLADQTGSDTLVCIFPGGQGATALANLSKGTMPYQEFMEDIETAYNEALSRGLQAIGRLAARSALGIIRNGTRFHGLIPQGVLRKAMTSLYNSTYPLHHWCLIPLRCGRPTTMVSASSTSSIAI